MHLPVLAGAALEWLRVRAEGIYVDCTAGAGGHSALIAERLSTGRLIALDRDPTAVELARKRLTGFGQASVHHRNYDELSEVLSELEIVGVDGVLIDAGLSSMQIDTPSRGFSFQEEGPLDMRMDPTKGQSALQFLESTDHAALARVLKQFGDVGPAKRIADAINDCAHQHKLHSTEDLAKAIARVIPSAKGARDETRKVFQAIRIAVNDELGSLERGIRQAVESLRPEGRLVVITFHSGEDRIAKNILRDESRATKELHPDGRVKQVIQPRLRLLTPKPVLPDRKEIGENPRAHSAKLRAAERLV